MAKVRTLTRSFMKGHPRQGQPTYFVEKFLRALCIDFSTEEYYDKLILLNQDKIELGNISIDDIKDFFCSLDETVTDNKQHTVRGGKHFITGDEVSIRCWLKKPYNSSQIILWDDVELKEVYDIRMVKENTGALPKIFISDKIFSWGPNDNFLKLSANDGLSFEDMMSWFNKLPFKGQILVWGNVKY